MGAWRLQSVSLLVTCYSFLHLQEIKSMNVLILKYFKREEGSLDNVESFELGSEKLQNFILHDKIDVERSNEWRFRLPWPLFDMTSVKIPVISNTVFP